MATAQECSGSKTVFGLANYYRRFIKNFGLIAAPLSELFKEHGSDKRKKRPIVWNTAHQLAFERLKQALTNAPVLHQPDPPKPYTIETGWPIAKALPKAT